MVRKVICMVICIVLLCAIGTVAHAESFEPYEGTPSNTYITYFRDIVSGIGFNDHYVALRSGQYEYILAVGDIQYGNEIFTSADTVGLYTISLNSGYNSTTSFTYREIDSLYISTNNQIIYSDLGHYPQLVERGAKYEMFTAVLLCTALLGVVVGRFFRKR